MFRNVCKKTHHKTKKSQCNKKDNGLVINDVELQNGSYMSEHDVYEHSFCSSSKSNKSSNSCPPCGCGCCPCSCRRPKCSTPSPCPCPYPTSSSSSSCKTPRGNPCGDGHVQPYGSGYNQNYGNGHSSSSRSREESFISRYVQHYKPQGYDPNNICSLKPYILFTIGAFILIGTLMLLSLYLVKQMNLTKRRESSEGIYCDSVNDLSKPKPTFTELADYANEEFGSRISHHNTYGYNQDKFGVQNLFGLPNIQKLVPNIILKNNDECYAFQGEEGHFVIELSRPIFAQYVTLQHKKVSDDAAPKDFIIFGVKDEKTQVQLGKFEYNNKGKSEQKFALGKINEEIKTIAIKILSNWGNTHYTCLYKIGVHGLPKF